MRRARVLLGTCGYSYKDWVGAFYPPGTRPEGMLPYYAARFPAVELDYTYYRMPGERTIAAIAAKSPTGFQVCVKANRAMTHEPPVAPAELARVFRAFAAALRPLLERGQLGCVLMQFPWSFRPSPDARDYLRRSRDLLPDLPVVIEFRNAAWVAQETFELLRTLGLGFCAVDEPRLRGLMPPVAEATAAVAYVRFHGRNARRWFNHVHAWERYDYRYSERELAEWVPRLRALAHAAVDAAAAPGAAASQEAKVFALFNNHHNGQAVDGALLLQRLLLAAEQAV